jgi:hypothetical protein
MGSSPERENRGKEEGSRGDTAGGTMGRGRGCHEEGLLGGCFSCSVGAEREEKTEGRKEKKRRRKERRKRKGRKRKGRKKMIFFKLKNF